MAKKTQSQPDSSVSSEIARLIAEVDKEYGAGIIRPGQFLLENPPNIIPFSPGIDTKVKGCPDGSFVTISGPPKTGKGVTALSFLAECQKPENGSRPVMILSVEHRLSQRDLMGIEGLKYTEPHLYFIESKKGRLLSSVDFLDIGGRFLKSCPGGVLLIDSVSALVNPDMMNENLDAQDRGAGNKYVCRFCDIYGPVCRVNGNIVVGIVQMYSNTSGKGAWVLEKVPSRFKHQTDLWLCLKSSRPWKTSDAEDAEEVGLQVTWEIKNSSIGNRGKVESWIRYGVGVDKVYELFLLANAFGIISGTGWYTFDFLEKKPELRKGTDYADKEVVKVQGKEKALQLLKDHPAWIAALYEAVGPFIRPAASSGA
jgi:hypothetical protein